MTSMATTVPAPLSVAVAEIQESRWPTEHHYFVFQRGIGAGNFGDGVEAVFVIAGELRFDVHLERDDVGLKEAVDAAIIFNRGDSEGKRIGLIAMIDLDAEGGAVVVEDGAAGAAVVLPPRLGKKDGGGLFAGEKFAYLSRNRAMNICRAVEPGDMHGIFLYLF